MKNRFLYSNPKALNLDSLRNTNKRVTMGVKCNSSLKLFLAEQAQMRGLTLSQYVEALLKNSNFQKLNFEITDLKNKIMFYENDMLRNLLVENKGKTISYNDRNGTLVNQPVKSIQDIFTILINSFQIKSNA